MERTRLGIWIGLFAILALVTSGSAGYAYPSLLGVTGGVQTPSPQVVPAGQYDLAVDYTKIKGDGMDVKTWPIRLVGGASERAELGIAYTRLKPDEGDSGRLTGIGGKYLIWMEPERPYSLAVGADYGDVGGDLEDAVGISSITRVYAVLGKDLTPEPGIYEEPRSTRAYGYVGLMYTRMANTDTTTSTRPFVGLEMVGEGGGSLALEWKSEEFGDDITSAVLRYQFNPTLMGEVGMTKNLGGLDISDSHRVFVGLSYRFGVPQEEDWEW